MAFVYVILTVKDDTLQKRNFPDINLEHAITMDTDLGERHDFHLLSYVTVVMVLHPGFPLI